MDEAQKAEFACVTLEQLDYSTKKDTENGEH